MLWLVLTFLLFLPLVYFGLSNPKRYRFAHAVRRVWGYILMLAACVKTRIVYEVPLNRKQAYMITPNHVSQFDIITLAAKLPLFFNFVAKAELEKIPLFGLWFRTLDIGVDRKDARKAALSYRKTLNWLEQGNSTVIYPEGTIPDSAPVMIRFKDGPFKMAIDKQIPVVPVTIIGNWQVMPDKGYLQARPGFVTVYVHAPIPTTGMQADDIATLRNRVFDIIAKKLTESGYPQS